MAHIRDADLTTSDALTQILQQTLLGDAWDHAEEAVVVFDEDRNYIAFNEAYCALLGYSRQEITLLKVGGTLVVDRDSREIFDAIIDRRSPRIGRALIRRKDGIVIAVCYRVIPTRVSALPYLIAIVWADGDAESLAR